MLLFFVSISDIGKHQTAVAAKRMIRDEKNLCKFIYNEIKDGG